MPAVFLHGHNALLRLRRLGPGRCLVLLLVGLLERIQQATGNGRRDWRGAPCGLALRGPRGGGVWGPGRGWVHGAGAVLKRASHDNSGLVAKKQTARMAVVLVSKLALPR